MENSPALSLNRQIVESYGGGGFRISGLPFTGSVLILPERSLSWPVETLQEVTHDGLRPVLDVDVELLLLGCGNSLSFVPSELRETLRESGRGFEAMDTGAACRTYNVLIAEGRRVAAALIAVD